jgi:quercetin dioxygenase-like cupin family protein
MSSNQRPLVVPTDEGTKIEGPVGGPLTFKLRGEESNQALTVFENTVAPGEGPPLHTHANEDEAWYVLDGKLRFQIGEALHSAEAGSFAFLPRGVAHCFQNHGTGPAKMLVIFTPSGMERFFARLAAITDEAIGPDAFQAAGSEVGMTVVGPPLRGD